jgi:hypothetical protein
MFSNIALGAVPPRIALSPKRESFPTKISGRKLKKSVDFFSFSFRISFSDSPFKIAYYLIRVEGSGYGFYQKVPTQNPIPLLRV